MNDETMFKMLNFED